jgi:hypothetical protein
VGSARRSTLPFEFKGNSSNTTKAEGIMYSGSFSLPKPRSSPVVKAAPGSPTT